MNWEVAIFHLVTFILFQVLSQCRFRKLWKITWRVYWSNILTPAKQTLSLLKKERWGTSPSSTPAPRTRCWFYIYTGAWRAVMKELGAEVRLGDPTSESPAKCPCLGWEGIPWLYHSAPYDLNSPGPASSCTGHCSWSQEPRGLLWLLAQCNLHLS